MILLGVILLFAAAAAPSQTHLPDRSHYLAPRAVTAVRIDGVADDPVWAKAEWREINQRWLGPEYSLTRTSAAVSKSPGTRGVFTYS